MIGYENYASFERLRHRMEAESPDPSELVPEMLSDLQGGFRVRLKDGFIELNDVLEIQSDDDGLWRVLASFIRGEITPEKLKDELVEVARQGCEVCAPQHQAYLMED